MRHSTLVVLLAMPMSLLGCSKTTWVPEDIDRDATVKALGDAGYQRLCSAFEGYIRDEYRSSYLIQAVCLAHGVQTTHSAVECGYAVQQCTDTLPPAAEALLQSILAQASCSAAEANPTGCSATVAQLLACLDALEDKLAAVKFGLACAAAGEPVDPNWWRIPPPAECLAIRSICPR